jgi:hypothetical protein
MNEIVIANSYLEGIKERALRNGLYEEIRVELWRVRELFGVNPVSASTRGQYVDTLRSNIAQSEQRIAQLKVLVDALEECA